MGCRMDVVSRHEKERGSSLRPDERRSPRQVVGEKTGCFVKKKAGSRSMCIECCYLCNIEKTINMCALLLIKV